jgi:hypothetical protein
MSKWALANVLETMKEVRPLARCIYKAEETDAEACERLARQFDGLAITAREAGKLAAQEAQG